MSEPRPSLPRTLGWAAYLGMSWTWCIGMFLPILLMRDFGVWAFAVFAIPNVVGAAAMGWVLRSTKAAAATGDTHRPAVRAFTLVTIAFHSFWLGWMLSLLMPDERVLLSNPVMGTLIGAVVVGLVLERLLRKGRDLVASVTVWAISLILGLIMLRVGAWESLHQHDAALFRVDGAPTLAFLAPVCIFGFLLCPYLDATFLRAREALAPKPSRLAFGLGFGGFFFSMILLTLAYSSTLEPATRPLGSSVTLAVSLALLPHFVLQSLFSIVLHIRAVPGGISNRRSGRVLFVLLCVALALVPANIADLAPSFRSYSGLAVQEVIYRLFMTFYGLIFPAYVWLCMIPTRDTHAGTLGPRGKRKLLTLAAAVLLASPCFWMGFIERETWWLAPGLGIVLLSRLAVMGRRGPRTGDDGFVRGGV